MPNRILLDDGTAPRMLDVLRIPIGPPAPKPHQPEDLTLEPGPWKLLQRPREWDTMVKLIRKVLIREPSLLGNDGDRVPYPGPDDPPLAASLAAVTAVDLKWWVGQSWRGSRQTRAVFNLAGREYNLAVTDDLWESRLGSLAEGLHPRETAGIREDERTVLIVSLGEPFEGFCYKLVAGILVADPLAQRAWG